MTIFIRGVSTYCATDCINCAKGRHVRLAWRDLIKQTIRDVVTRPDKDAFFVIQQAVLANVPDIERGNVQALIVEELRRLHEGVLARYGLRRSEFTA